MARRLILNPSIPSDLTAALNHYDEISPALGNRCRAEVDRRLDDIADRPESFPLDVSPIRFAKLHRFPYIIFFTVKGTISTTIIVGAAFFGWKGCSKAEEAPQTEPVEIVEPVEQQ